jgi:uncharacterized glyoxalase superfamily protein PhnB
MLSITPELLVDNLPKTLDWYKSVLGFETIFISPESGVPTFARIKLGSAEIMLFTRSDFGKEIPAFSTAPMGGSFVLYLEVEDIKTIWSRVKDKTIVIQPLHQTTYGSEEFSIQDCNGYHLMFGERG